MIFLQFTHPHIEITPILGIYQPAIESWLCYRMGDLEQTIVLWSPVFLSVKGFALYNSEYFSNLSTSFISFGLFSFKRTITTKHMYYHFLTATNDNSFLCNILKSQTILTIAAFLKQSLVLCENHLEKHHSFLWNSEEIWDVLFCTFNLNFFS